MRASFQSLASQDGPARLGVLATSWRTAGQRRRFERNLVMYLAHRSGLSHRLLARAFGLTHSAVNGGIAKIRRMLAEKGLDAEAVANVLGDT